jgi:hypothetical protein
LFARISTLFGEVLPLFSKRGVRGDFKIPLNPPLRKGDLKLDLSLDES